MRRPAPLNWRWLLIGTIAVAQGIFTAWLVLKPGGETSVLYLDDIAVAAAPFVGALLCLKAADRQRGTRAGLAWLLISIGMFSFCFGDASWAYQEIILGKEVPFPSISDGGYLFGYVPVFFGLLLRPSAPTTSARRFTMLLDVLIALCAVAILSWRLIIGELLAQSSQSVVSDGISVAYPMLDVMIVFAALLLVARARPGYSMASLICLAGAFAATAFSDSLYTYLNSVGGYSTGSYIDIGWFAGYNMVTVAALLFLSPDATDAAATKKDGQPASLWQLCILYAAVVPVGGLIIFRNPQFIEAAIVGVFLLAFVRHIVTILENAVLNRRLAELTGELEIRIKTQTLQLLTRAGHSTSGDPSSHPESPSAGP